MRALLIILIFSFPFLTYADASQLRPFETDYCTNYSEGTRSNPDLWKHCCLIHDLYFWAGGTKQDRYNADIGLKRCVEETGAYYRARLIYYAVRAGSYSPIKFPDKKWNNGWKDRPDFQSLSREDIDNIEIELSSGYDFISHEIKDDFIINLRSRLE